MTTLIIVSAVLVLTNFIFLSRYLKYRQSVKQRGLFGNWPIPPISLEQLDPIFKVDRFGPKLETMIHFLGRGDLNVPGGTSDSEAWILSVLAKRAGNIFEFGTCTGKTAYLFAKNSAEHSTVTTLTLSPEQVSEYAKGTGDDQKSIEDAVSESAFTEFLYSNTPEKTKITQLFCDSKHFDERPYLAKMDLIFIDGSHAYSYVLNDSEKAFKMLAPGGIILWHDYRGPRNTKDVYKALNQLAREKTLVRIKETSLVAYRN